MKFPNINKEWTTDSRVTGNQHMLKHRDQHHSLFAYDAIYFSTSVQRLTGKRRFQILRMMKSFGTLNYVIKPNSSSCCFKGSYCLHFQGQGAQKDWLWRRRQYDLPKWQRLFTPRHSIVFRRLQFGTHCYVGLKGQVMAQTVAGLLPWRSWHTRRPVQVADRLAAFWKVFLWVLRFSAVRVIPHSFDHSSLTLSNHSIWHHG